MCFLIKFIKLSEQTVLVKAQKKAGGTNISLTMAQFYCTCQEGSHTSETSCTIWGSETDKTTQGTAKMTLKKRLQ